MIVYCFYFLVVVECEGVVVMLWMCDEFQEEMKREDDENGNGDDFVECKYRLS